MEQCLLGIGILLFAILMEMCSNGLSLFSLGIGLIGLLVLIIGFVNREK